LVEIRRGKKGEMGVEQICGTPFPDTSNRLSPSLISTEPTTAPAIAIITAKAVTIETAKKAAAVETVQPTENEADHRIAAIGDAEMALIRGE
jgi:hypothetical protein